MEQRKQLLSWVDEARDTGARQTSACEILGLSIRTLQRWRKDQQGDQRPQIVRHAHNKLSENEREAALAVLNAPTYTNMAPSQIVPCLADEGCYVASESTLYRILRNEKLLVHRHAWGVKKHIRPAPLVATAPNQLYSWDISYLPSTVRGLFFYLYLFVDIFSRKIVGWQVYDCESSHYAADLLKDICLREDVDRNQIVLHSDNGKPMKGTAMLLMLQELGVMPSFSRPSVSDDNPYSEALFRTVKYVPHYPGYFASVQEARDYMESFVHWYNEEHRHSGIRFVTPGQRHRGEDKDILAKRHQVYMLAKEQNPKRWSGKTRNWNRIETVHLNPEKGKSQNIALAEAI
jgi:transposase InsO family protein